jgi:DNA-binding LacI/PurR family transcriptional regulator
MNLLPAIGHSAGAHNCDSTGVDADDGAEMIAARVRDKRCTALVAPRDYNAYQLYDALALKGIRIPRDCSLISFDNYAMLQAAPVSSIDFGMGYLGYCAFHFLFGVIPVTHKRNGDIPSRPHLVNRGSTGRPGI